MLTVTHAMIDYWKRLPVEPPAARRRRLDTLIERIRAATDRRDALLPFALGDVEDGIVSAAMMSPEGANSLVPRRTVAPA